MPTEHKMSDREIVQLVHEGYHPIERIAEWAGLPVRVVEEIYQAELDSPFSLYTK